MRSSLALFILFLVAVIWGLTFPILKISLQFISPMGFISLRFFLAFLLLLIIFREKRENMKAALKAGFIIGIFLFLGHLFQTVGLKYTTASHAGFITGLYVVFTPIFAWMFLRERISVKIILAVIISTFGLYLLSNYEGKPNIGDFLTLLGAIAYALQVVSVGKYSRIYDPSAITVVELGTVFLFSTAGWGVEGLPISLTPPLILGVLFVGIVATALAILMQTHAQKLVAASQAVIFYTAEPVFAGIFSYFLLGETLSISGMVGAFLILLGMLLVSLDRSHPTPQ